MKPNRFTATLGFLVFLFLVTTALRAELAVRAESGAT